MAKKDESKPKATPKSEKRRVYATGSERAEFEHIYGPLQSDPNDPRFVLIDAETEEKLRKLPPGVPPTSGQDWHQVERIKEAMADAEGDDAPAEEPAKEEKK